MRSFGNRLNDNCVYCAYRVTRAGDRRVESIPLHITMIRNVWSYAKNSQCVPVLSQVHLIPAFVKVEKYTYRSSKWRG